MNNKYFLAMSTDGKTCSLESLDGPTAPVGTLVSLSPSDGGLVRTGFVAYVFSDGFNSRMNDPLGIHEPMTEPLTLTEAIQEAVEAAAHAGANAQAMAAGFGRT